jgi:hypothetical protein
MKRKIKMRQIGQAIYNAMEVDKQYNPKDLFFLIKDQFDCSLHYAVASLVFLSKDHKDLVCNLETYNYYFIKKNTKKA